RLRMLACKSRFLRIRSSSLAFALLAVYCLSTGYVCAESGDWALANVEIGIETVAPDWTPNHFSTEQARQPPSTIRFLHASEVAPPRIADARVARVEFNQSATDEPPLPAYLRPFQPAEEVPQPHMPEAQSLPDVQSPDQSVAARLDEMARRLDEL